LRSLLVFLVCTLTATSTFARDRGADGRFDERRSTRFLLRQDVDIDVRSGPRGGRAFERGVLEALEEGADQLDDRLGLRLRRRIEVVIYDPAVFDADFAGLSRFPAAGFYAGTIRVRGDTAITPQLRSTLHHELVHAAFDAEAPGLALPGWLHEGLAEWFEAELAGRPLLGPGEAAQLARLGAQGRLFPIERIGQRSFARFDGGDAALAYAQARALVAEMVRLGGGRAPGEMVERLLRTHDLDGSLERTIGLDSAGLEASLLATLGLTR
jgi:hypothetical protein